MYVRRINFLDQIQIDYIHTYIVNTQGTTLIFNHQEISKINYVKEKINRNFNIISHYNFKQKHLRKFLQQNSNKGITTCIILIYFYKNIDINPSDEST